jgi:hypothetical protein
MTILIQVHVLSTPNAGDRGERGGGVDFRRVGCCFALGLGRRFGKREGEILALKETG